MLMMRRPCVWGSVIDGLTNTQATNIQSDIIKSKNKNAPDARAIATQCSISSHKEYYCPNCGAILNDQDGFDPRNGNWSCASCGQELYGDDVYEGNTYPGVMWHCDRCGALLNKQNGFQDSCGSWTCTECCHSNPISEDAIL
jgi:ribosomal protein L37AE/L43A